MRTTGGERDAPGARSPALGYQPGLDGLRALALLAIFVVHADVGLASGAFLAVSTFFTLSGFLITSLLLSERDRTGSVDLRRFWSRRARRLLPAALVAVAGTTVVTVVLGDAAQVGRIRDDALGALVYVANWRFVAAGDTYGARFESESPLLHFWSLAIEEQLYVVFPLAMVAAFALARRHRLAVPVVLGGLLAASQLAGILLSRSASVDRLYFGTDVRAAELVVGALAAWWWSQASRRPSTRRAAVLAAGGPCALVAMGVLIATARSTDLFWYRGGLVAYACLTTTVVIAAIQPGGTLRRMLSWPPLVWVGVTSYGAYLVHWPLFVWLRSETALDGSARLLLGSAAALAAATLSYLLVEHPVRSAATIPRPLLVVAPVALVSIALLAPVVAPPATSGEVALDDRRDRLEAALDAPVADTDLPTAAVFGDSTALSTALGLGTRDDRPGATVSAVQGWSQLGCSILSPVELVHQGRQIATPEECTGFAEEWRIAAADSQPDVAMVQVGPWEVCDVRLPSDDTWRSVGDPVVDEAIVSGLVDGAMALLEEVPAVVLATSPVLVPGARSGEAPDEPFPEGDPARVERFNELVREAAAADERFGVVDIGSHLDARPDLDAIRPDGVHLTVEASVELAPWLGERLAEAAGAASSGADP